MISVIMPVYNAEKYLKESIESILNQTEQKYEFIIINDGSTDRSEQIINSYDDERIVYVYQNNQGEAAARNAGLRIAKGIYIVWQDADDVSLPNRLQVLKDEIEAYDADFVHSDVLLIEEQGVPIGYWQSKQVSSKNILSYFLKIGTPFNNPSIMFKRDTFLGVNFDEDLRIGTDTDFISQIFTNLNIKTVHVNKPLLLYRRHGSSLTSLENNYNVLNLHLSKFLQRTSLMDLFPEINWKNNNQVNNEAIAYIILAYLLAKRGLFIHANDYIEKAKSYEVSNETEKFIVGMGFMLLKDYDQAISNFKLVKDKDAITENYIGESYCFKGDFVTAKKHFLNAIYLAPDYNEPIENLRAIGSSLGFNLIDHTWRKFVK
ncbi:glycosyltransferase [Bacillus timonensis]|uniref:glycosyltransferase n=1 Tax=Bacillus timonensis TaxID=1033734 RepID=UPI000288E3A7|nr:glycosyltransferase [Bacillus timonensis]